MFFDLTRHITSSQEYNRMTIGLDNKPGKNGTPKKKANGNGAHLVKTDKKGHYVFKHQGKRMQVVALYCDCGRSILVNPKDIENAPIICSLCNSSFSWQQLSFPLD